LSNANEPSLSALTVRVGDDDSHTSAPATGWSRSSSTSPSIRSGPSGSVSRVRIGVGPPARSLPPVLAGVGRGAVAVPAVGLVVGA
jgi:hypothetical protein